MQNIWKATNNPTRMFRFKDLEIGSVVAIPDPILNKHIYGVKIGGVEIMDLNSGNKRFVSYDEAVFVAHNVFINLF